MASQEDEREQQSAPTDLFGSLKIVSEAAQSTFSNQSHKVDMGEVAGAASNLLSAASQYGNLDDQQGFGKYVDQAQGYLQKYHQSSQSGGSPQAATDEPTQTESPERKRPDATTDDDGKGAKPRKVATEEEVDAEPKKDEQEEEGGGGFGSAGVGDYAKITQGKSAGEDDADTKGTEEGLGGSGVGDYVKIAQGLIGNEGEEKENKEGAGAGVGDYVKIAKGLFG